MRDAAKIIKPRKKFGFGGRLSRYLAMRRQFWESGVWEIRQRNIFILPNRYGFYAGFLVLSSFAMGYKVQNNFILLAVIFLFLVFMLSLIAGVRNLQGLQVDVRIAPYYFADQAQQIHLNFTKSTPAFAIMLISDLQSFELDLSQGASSVVVKVGHFGRGVYGVPPIKLVSNFPLGIAVTWSWLNPPGQIIVAPIPNELPLGQYVRGHPMLPKADTKQRQQMDRADDLGDLRDYRPDDPPKRIDWNRFAATREMLVREYSNHAQGELVLSQPNGDLEAALSYLAGGLRVAQHHATAARMILNGIEYRVYGQSDREKAYYALALAQ